MVVVEVVVAVVVARVLSVLVWWLLLSSLPFACRFVHVERFVGVEFVCLVLLKTLFESKVFSDRSKIKLFFVFFFCDFVIAVVFVGYFILSSEIYFRGTCKRSTCTFSSSKSPHVSILATKITVPLSDFLKQINTILRGSCQIIIIFSFQIAFF